MKGYTLILVLLILTLASGCKKTVECIEGGTLSGDIKGFLLWPKCYIAANWSANGFVIRDMSDLDTAANCVAEAFGVDFSKYSVLGRHIEVNCNLFVAREVKIDHVTKEYRYTMSVIQCGDCKSIAIDDNLVLVDKLPSDYNVRFEVVYE